MWIPSQLSLKQLVILLKDSFTTNSTLPYLYNSNHYILSSLAFYLRFYKIFSSSLPRVVPQIFKIIFLFDCYFNSSESTYSCRSCCFSGRNWARDIIWIYVEQLGFFKSNNESTVHGGYTFVSNPFLSREDHKFCICPWVQEELVCAKFTVFPINLYNINIIW